jgi:hypothetical protein
LAWSLSGRAFIQKPFQMTTQELLIKNLGNPSDGINIIVQNNPAAVAQKAIDLGLNTTFLDPPALMQLINELLRSGDIEAVKKLLAVPFNPNSENATQEYAFLFEPYKGSKSADGSSVDWWTVAGSALIGGLTGLMNQNGQAATPGAANTNTNQQGQSVQTQSTGSNTVLIIVAVVFGIAVITAIGYFLVKAAK